MDRVIYSKLCILNYLATIDQMQLFYNLSLDTSPSYSQSEEVRQMALTCIILILRMYSKMLFASIYLFDPGNLHCNYHLGLVHLILH